MTKQVCKDPRCVQGNLYDDEGTYWGICPHVIRNNLYEFHKWSGSNLEHFQLIDDLEFNQTIKLRLGPGQYRSIKMKDEIELLADDYESLLGNSSRIICRGPSGEGKTQFAMTLSNEISKRTMLNYSDSSKHVKFYYLSLMRLVVFGLMYDSNEIEKITRHIKASNILILDDLGEDVESGYKKNKEPDKRHEAALNFLKSVLDFFDGLIIVTTNDSEITTRYENKPRLQSRLFGEADVRGNLLTYVLAEGVDYRDKVVSKGIQSLKNRFK